MADEVVKSEKKKRAVTKARVTKKEKYFLDLDIEKVEDVIEFQLKKKDFDETVKEFKEIQIRILELLVEEVDIQALAEETVQMEERSLTVQLIYEKVKKILELKDEDDPETEDEDELSNHSHGRSSRRSQKGHAPTKSAFRLPEIVLPTFSGNYDEWLDFRKQFECLVKNDAGINENMKFLYLRSCLKGDARNLQCPEEKFDTLWTALVNTYENKRYIVNKHISDLRSMKSMSRNSGTDLRQIINEAKKHVRAFCSLDFEMNGLNEAILIQIVSEKVDYVIRNDFELSLEPTELPSWNKFVTYIEKRCNTLESIEMSKKKASDSHEKATVSKKKTSSKIFSNVNDSSKSKLQCYFCSQSHYLSRCEEFRKLNLNDRWAKVRELDLCPNCLNKGHNENNCSRPACTCGKMHNKLLHVEPKETSGTNGDKKIVNFNNSFLGVSTNRNQILLGTALVWVYDKFGKRHLCRSLIDSGAMSNVISESLAQRLGLSREKVKVSVGVINDVKLNVNHKVHGTVESRFSSFKRSLEFLVVSHITGNLPLYPLDSKRFRIPKNIQLADEGFCTPNKIDLLLGMEVFHEIFSRKGDVLSFDGVSLFAENSELGYVVSGKVSEPATHIGSVFCGLISNDELHQEMKKFWDYENVKSKKVLTMEEKAVESFFEESHYRYDDGRYGVYMPLKPDISNLGDSKVHATQRFLSLERKLEKNPILKMEYQKFLDEYLELNHMELYNENVDNVPSEGHYFLPHHAVFKANSENAKLRVVFSGSAQTTRHNSLNSCSYVGPNLQNDYLRIVLRFRFLRYVFSCDAKKMYRQCRVHKSHRIYLLILWRSNKGEPIRVYCLCTVTYGTASAAYLSTRVLIQLSFDEKDFPLASEIIRRDFYVDDCLSGARTLKEAIELRNQLIELMKRGQFELHKWCANCPELLMDIPEHDRELKKEIIEEGESVKALGISWDPLKDKFMFIVNKEIFVEKKLTKRNVLSDIAKYYDPLGITEPVKLYAKVFMQQLWLKHYGWDDLLDEEDSVKWLKFRDDLSEIKPFELPRFVLTENEMSDVQIHGFCDASLMGYGACVYVRAVDAAGGVVVNLLCSRSRVAPVSFHSIPRLELLAANLLAHLMESVTDSIPSFVEYKKFYWSDSRIVLSWIRMTSRSLKTFVGHKVSEIQELTNINAWRHVSSEDNPADPLSRGLLPSKLVECKNWWKGSPFLSRLEEPWLEMKFEPMIEVPEVKTQTQVFTVVKSDPCEMFTKYSDFLKLIRIVAMMLRFFGNMKLKCKGETLIKGRIKISELKKANLRLVRLVQEEVYTNDYNHLLNNETLSKKSNLLSLSPFLDQDGIMRVGGRLSKAPIPFNQKHPMILPQNHDYSTLLIRWCHEENLHQGVQFTLNFLRTRFWIIHGRNAVKKVIKACVKCYRMKPKVIDQFMGDLPEARLQPAFPFQKTSVDYCGPFMLKANPRGTIKSKGYVAVFQCMVTRGIHLELAGDMTADSFLNCLYRFVGRRGEVSELFSDNGTNFKGANNKMNEFYRLCQSQEYDKAINSWCERKSVTWNFIPPQCPHMGGTWESAVKLTKTLLVKFLSEALLSYEEFSTVLCRIESVLNSRPITKLTEDASDLNALTPGHLLIGRPLNELLEPDLSDLKMGRLSRFQYLTRLKQDFWKQWSHDYLHQLQMRYKWNDKIEVRLGQIVIVKEDNVPSCNWILGRIVKLHPGTDGITRVVTLQTQKGSMTRHLARLCYLPIEDNNMD